MSYEVVIPTAGRLSLERLLSLLLAGDGPSPERVIVVDDRRPRRRGRGRLGAAADPPGAAPLPLGEAAGDPRLRVLRGPGRGPAAARNAGWRAAAADWVAFLDDDVEPPPGWRAALAADLAALPPRAAASQGRIVVPLPAGRRPTDWERNTAGLERARWATADMAYRRAALAAVGGFDERFPRAYREDADLGLRLVDAGWSIVPGRRGVVHPVRPAARLISVRLQAGNADDVLMRALHGSDWRERAGAPAGRLPRHLATAGAGLAGLAALVAGRPRAAALGVAGWAAGTAELTLARVAPGPRTRDELATMLLSSPLLPPLAALAWIRGHARSRALLRDSAPAPRPEPVTAPAPRPEPVTRLDGDRRGRAPEAVLLDRDGTIVVDVPYNGDPDAVRPLPGARAALDRLRGAGVRLAVVSNQSGIARGVLSRDQLDAVNRRVERELGPLGEFVVCPHGPDDRCACRKPAPGLVIEAARRLGVAPEACVVIGDIGADVEAARAAGARGVLVPTARTLRAEVEAAPETAPDLGAAVDLVLGATAAGTLEAGR